MEQYKNRLTDLQTDIIKATQCISKMLMSNSQSPNVISRQMDDYLCELENLCVKSRAAVEKYRPFCEPRGINEVNTNIQNICGGAEVTDISEIPYQDYSVHADMSCRILKKHSWRL